MSTVLASPADVRSLLTEAFLRRFDTPGPRYTSYPRRTAFSESFGPDQAAGRARGARAAGAAAPLSLYVHIPFCEQLCYYCACNKIITKHHERAAPYLDALEAELALVVASLGTDRPVSQLHFGGGSPTFLADDELRASDAGHRRDVSPDAGLRGLDRGRPAHRHARAAGAFCRRRASTA
jgi:oxygen-independent coproporphyrinogen-3 oxidase